VSFKLQYLPLKARVVHEGGSPLYHIGEKIFQDYWGEFVPEISNRVPRKSHRKREGFKDKHKLSCHEPGLSARRARKNRLSVKGALTRIKPPDGGGLHMLGPGKWTLS